jgi:hypothetical protein
MKTRLLLSLIVFGSALAWQGAAAQEMEMQERFLSPQEVLADLVLLRPLGVAMTVAGTALFIATSPFTAMAAVAPPHDAFERSSDVLVVAPAAFTFMRPLGDFRYQPSALYPVQP